MTAPAGDAEAELVHERLDQLIRDHWPAPDRTSFLAAQFELGLAWVHFPAGKGGLGVRRALQHDVTVRLAEIDAPDGRGGNPLAYSMGAPTVLAWGTEAQISRYLKPAFLGTELWCQLFSEPGAGSDLAAAACRAVRDGDDWVVNGQKVWNSMAHLADIGMLVARTDPDVPKHQGLTYFLVDMHSDGIEVRPLRQLTGDAEFNEVYLTDVRIPDAGRLADVGAGWKVSISTLMNERVMFGSEGRQVASVDAALELYRERHRTDPVLRARLIDLWIRARVLGLNNARVAAKLGQGTAGPEGSVGKVGWAEIQMAGYELCLDLMGDESLLYSDYSIHQPENWETRHEGADLPRQFLRSRANSIEGGTTEIMRNIIAERVLGLPSEARVDKDRPWSQVPRG